MNWLAPAAPIQRPNIVPTMSQAIATDKCARSNFITAPSIRLILADIRQMNSGTAWTKVLLDVHACRTGRDSSWYREFVQRADQFARAGLQRMTYPRQLFELV